MNEIVARWNALPERTRLLALAGTFVIGVLLLFTAIWTPLQKDLSRLRVSVPKAAGELAWMRSQAPLAKAARTRAVTTSGSLTSSIEQSAATHNMRSYVSRIEQEGNAGARVTLEAAPFNSLVVWLAALQATHGVSIEDATIEAHATAGLVSARLRLRAGGA